MENRIAIIDCDGTLTDAEEEGIPFTAACYNDLAVLMGLPNERVRDLAGGHIREIRRNPQRYGPKRDGRIVAPADADPYLRTGSVAEYIFDAKEMFPNEADRTAVIRLLFAKNYRNTRIVFRPGAWDAIARLMGTPTYVVTNSGTSDVRGKLAVLAGGGDAEGSSIGWILENIRGDARKFDLGDELDGGVPEWTTIPGIDRRVYVRRTAYFRVLDAIRVSHGVSWTDLRVVGDILELDGILPLAFGARFALLPNAHTMPAEIAYVRDHPRGRILTSVADIPEFVAEN